MKIKSIFFIPCIAVFIMQFFILCPVYAQEPVDNLMDELKTEYEKVMPPSPTSSVNSDYPVKQTAIGVFYSAKLMANLIKQNQILNSKYDETMKINQDFANKLGLLIKQNNEIIKLLKAISENMDQGK